MCENQGYTGESKLNNSPNSMKRSLYWKKLHSTHEMSKK